MNSDTFTRLDFGKYRGLAVADVPGSYLRWVLRTVEIDNWLRVIIEDSLRRRQARADASGRTERQEDDTTRQEDASSDLVPRSELQTTVQRWYRGLAARYHHDRGVDQQVMQALNVARDELLVALGID